MGEGGEGVGHGWLLVVFGIALPTKMLLGLGRSRCLIAMIIVLGQRTSFRWPSDGRQYKA